ncbi:MAG TPA: ATP-grasp domain-containing protein, partial [Telluria sp.]
MKVFAFDYAEAGGPMGRPVPASLRRQGSMLLHALLADLGALPDVELITLAPVCAAGGAQPPFSERFEACLAAADAVWPLASEPDYLLERLSRQVLRGGRVLLGSAPAAIRVAASKITTARALLAAGVNAVDTYSPQESLPLGEGAWVVKPDDGAGCLDTRLFSDRGAALTWTRASAAEGYVLQPFVSGKLGSLSMLCRDGVARVLSRNLERVAVRDNQFHFLGSTVNGIDDADGALERMAQQVAAAIPGLWGYVGVDFILTADGPTVLEVNARLTAAYAGLHASLRCNPAGLVIGLLAGTDLLPEPVANPAC